MAEEFIKGVNDLGRKAVAASLMETVQRLGEEAQGLIQQREQFLGLVREIEIRLHQISGAVSEFDKIIKELSSEVGKDRRQEVSEGSEQPTPAERAPQDGI